MKTRYAVLMQGAAEGMIEENLEQSASDEETFKYDWDFLGKRKPQNDEVSSPSLRRETDMMYNIDNMEESPTRHKPKDLFENNESI